MSCFVIAEAGVNHNGSLELALQLIEIAAKAGADAVKFQTFKAESLVIPAAEKAAYQKANTGEGSQWEMLKSLEMSEEMHHVLFERCTKLNIEFMSTAFDIYSLDFLIKLGIKRIKIPSGEITNHPFLEYISCKDVPILLSTGMSSLQEVIDAVAVIRKTRTQCGFTKPLNETLVLLHCTSNYPTQLKDVNLKAMRTLSSITNLPVGYSDHTEGNFVSPLAVAMGACVIEKHFTVNKQLPGPDHKASLEPSALSEMIKQIRYVEVCLGTGEKCPQKSELAVRDLVRRSVTLCQAKKKGEILSEKDLVILRPGMGIHPSELPQVIGKMLLKDLNANTTLQWDYLE